MAKNLIEQFLDFATSKLTGPIGDDIYIKETHELTGVARYLARQEEAAQAATSTAMTGVEKYLARQAKAAEPAAATVEAQPAQETAAPLSGVAKYLARQGGKATPTAATTESEKVAVADVPAAPMSRVEKYLASQEKTAKAPAATAQETAAPVSRVAKYLANQEKTVQSAAESTTSTPESPAPVSRVAKYLASQEPASKPVAAEAKSDTETKGAEAEEAAPLSRVAKYLASISKEFKPEVADPAPADAPATASAAKTGVEKYLASGNSDSSHSARAASPLLVSKVSKYVEPKHEEIHETTDVATDEIETSVIASSDVVHLDDGLQCQASTQKGTQCRNKSNLGHIQQTINNQKYQFSVCTQHNNAGFKPFADLVGA